MRARRSTALPLALAFALLGCAQVEECPEPPRIDTCASYERLVDESVRCLAAGRTDEVRAQHELADEARILREFAELDLRIQGTVIMGRSIEVPFESRPRT